MRILKAVRFTGLLTLAFITYWVPRLLLMWLISILLMWIFPGLRYLGGEQ